MNDEVKFHPEKFKIHTDIGWKTSAIGIFLVNCGGDNKFKLIITGDSENDFVVAENIEEALKLAKEKLDFGLLALSDLKTRRRRSRYLVFFLVVVMSVFDGGLNPENEDIKYYYPTSDLVTG